MNPKRTVWVLNTSTKTALVLGDVYGLKNIFLAGRGDLQAISITDLVKIQQIKRRLQK